MAVNLYAGTYDKVGGHGLTALTYCANEGWTVGERYGLARNASYGAYAPHYGLHYLVNERSEGALGTYRETLSGWQQIACVATQGEEPCYVSLDPSEEWLAVANYGSGDIALFALASGIPCEPPAVRKNRGSGPVSDRQDGPHAHCALFSPDGRWLYHVDLGTDQVLAYPFDTVRGALGEQITAYRAPSGAGPRHLLFHPRLPSALLVSELAATLTVLDAADGHLSERQTLSTAPAGYSGENLGGHLAINEAGDRVYVTNRGHDSIAVFAFEDGKLGLLQHVPSGGASPRFFLLLEAERLLFCANEEGGNISAFRIEQDGRLSPLPGNLSLPGAVFLILRRA